MIATEPDSLLLSQREPVDCVGDSCKGGKLNERQHPWCTLPGNMDLKTAPKDSAAQRNYLALGGEIIPDGGGNCNNAKALSDVTNPDQTVTVLVR